MKILENRGICIGLMLVLVVCGFLLGGYRTGYGDFICFGRFGYRSAIPDVTCLFRIVRWFFLGDCDLVLVPVEKE